MYRSQVDKIRLHVYSKTLPFARVITGNYQGKSSRSASARTVALPAHEEVLRAGVILLVVQHVRDLEALAHRRVPSLEPVAGGRAARAPPEQGTSFGFETAPSFRDSKLNRNHDIVSSNDSAENIPGISENVSVCVQNFQKWVRQSLLKSAQSLAYSPSPEVKT